MVIKHKHHIIPKHAGGTDDASNLVELSIKDHAEAHRRLYKKYGRWEDQAAWLGLAAMIDHENLIRMIQREGQRKGGQKSKGRVAGFHHSKETKLRISKANAGLQTWLGKHHSAATRKQMSESHQGKHVGKLNSQFGSMWITDGTQSKKIFKRDQIPEGWRKGRVVRKSGRAD